MAPPTFVDLGKQARDLFSKNYHFGLIKLDCKSTTRSGVQFIVDGSSNNDTGRVGATFEAKYKFPEYGVTIKEKWTTDNVLLADVSVEDNPAEGLKLSADTLFEPETGKKNGALRAAYKNVSCAVNTDFLFDCVWPVIHSSAVMHYQGWLAGSQLAFDVQQKKLTTSNFAISYSQGDFVVFTSLNNGKEFSGSMYQKVNHKLETGLQLLWTAGTNLTRFGMAFVYRVDKDTFIRAKVNNSSQIGVGYSHRLRPGIQLSLSALLDGKNFNQGGHKIGLGLDFEP